MKAMKIDLLRPKVPSFEDLTPYLKRIDKTGKYSNFGPLNEELISRLADYFDVEYSQVHTVSNATQGINGAIQILSKDAGSVWDLPAWTFAATPSALKQARGYGVFCDIDNEWRVIPSSESSFLIDVLPFGDNLRSKPLPKNIHSIVIDGAASFDALKQVGKNLETNTFLIVSMHATKLMPGGEGGIVIIKNHELSKKFRSWTNYGFESSRHSINFGTNAKISEYTAAVALASLDQWDLIRNKFLENSKFALEVSRSLSLNVNTSMTNGYATPYWILKCESPDQKESFVSSLRSNSIAYRDWWEAGCHKMSAFSSFKFGTLDNTDKVSSLTLGLPFHYFMRESDFLKILSVLEKVY
jgi:dTDP-4-amino-4,6-dideoxygalactose transaminase